MNGQVFQANHFVFIPAPGDGHCGLFSVSGGIDGKAVRSLYFMHLWAIRDIEVALSSGESVKVSDRVMTFGVPVLNASADFRRLKKPAVWTFQGYVHVMTTKECYIDESELAMMAVIFNLRIRVFNRQPDGSYIQTNVAQPDYFVADINANLPFEAPKPEDTIEVCVLHNAVNHFDILMPVGGEAELAALQQRFRGPAAQALLDLAAFVAMLPEEPPQPPQPRQLRPRRGGPAGGGGSSIARNDGGSGAGGGGAARGGGAAGGGGGSTRGGGGTGLRGGGAAGKPGPAAPRGKAPDDGGRRGGGGRPQRGSQAPDADGFKTVVAKTQKQRTQKQRASAPPPARAPASARAGFDALCDDDSGGGSEEGEGEGGAGGAAPRRPQRGAQPPPRGPPPHGGAPPAPGGGPPRPPGGGGPQQQQPPRGPPPLQQGPPPGVPAADAPPREPIVIVQMGLRKALMHPDDEAKLVALVDANTEICFHAYSILWLYAARIGALAQLPDDLIAPLYREAGEVFNQTVIDQSLALVRVPGNEDKANNKAPEMLKQVARDYFVDDLDDVRTTRPAASLLSVDVTKETREQMHTAIDNLLQHATAVHQRSALRQIHGLSAEEVETLCALVSTSAAKRLVDAQAAFVTRAFHAAHQARRNVEVAQRHGAPPARLKELEKAAAAAQRTASGASAHAKNHPAEAMAALTARHPLPKNAARRAVVAALVAAELARVPADQKQLPLLRYRADLLFRLEAARTAERAANAAAVLAGKEDKPDDYWKLFNLMPRPGFTRIFARLTAPVLSTLMSMWDKPEGDGEGKQQDGDDGDGDGEQRGTKRKAPEEGEGDGVDGDGGAPPPAETAASMYLRSILKEKALSDLRRGGREIGNSVLTDGVALQVLMVTPQQQSRKRNATAAGVRTKQLKEEAKKQGIPWVPPEKEAPMPKPKAAPKPKPKAAPLAPVLKDERVVGVDLGVVNVATWSAEDGAGGWEEPIAYSTRRFYAESGQTGRQRRFNRACAERAETNQEFADAQEAVNAARTKTADPVQLLAALQARGKAFRTLYAMYGSEAQAVTDLKNYGGRKRTLVKLVKLIAPNKKFVVVMGDAQFGMNVKGHPPGQAKRLYRVAQLLLGSHRLRDFDEFRTTVLDTIDHTYMVHLPKMMAVNRYGQTYLQRVNGLYQNCEPGASRLWHRDKGSSLSIGKNFRHQLTTGDVPYNFRRSTKKEDIPPSSAADYHYTAMPGRSDNKFLRRRSKA